MKPSCGHALHLQTGIDAHNLACSVNGERSYAGYTPRILPARAWWDTDDGEPAVTAYTPVPRHAPRTPFAPLPDQLSMFA